MKKKTLRQAADAATGGNLTQNRPDHVKHKEIVYMQGLRTKIWQW